MVFGRLNRYQRPNKNHKTIITGIGTPSSQSRIPRPIVASLLPHWRDNATMRPQVPARRRTYQWPVFGIEAHGSAGGLASPFCNSSIECKSGERINAIWPSRGGRLMVIPCAISFAQVA